MPLITICGLPGSGKTTRANELARELGQKANESAGRVKKVAVVTDDDLGVTRDMYREKDSEKQARSQQLSAVKRMLDKDTIVIFDNMSYIKGFRYQLSCEARSVSTTACTVYLGTPAEKCDKSQWPEDLWKALEFRFEEPNGMARWDAPLFIVLPEDKLPVDEIWSAIVDAKPVVPNSSTKLKPAAPVDYLQQLNDRTAEIVKEVMSLHQDAAGAQVIIDGESLHLPLTLSLAQLNRLRRNFISFNRSSGIPADRVRAFFVDYLSKNLDNI